MQTVYRACAKIEFDDRSAQQHFGPCRLTLALAEGDVALMREKFRECERMGFDPSPLSINTWIQNIDSHGEVEVNRMNYNVAYEWPIS